MNDRLQYGKPGKPSPVVTPPAPVKPDDTDDKKMASILEEVSVKEWNPSWQTIYATLQRKTQRQHIG